MCDTAAECKKPTASSSQAGVTRKRQHADTQSGTSSSCAAKYKKPSRPCVFCGQLQSKLKRHLLRKHKDEEQVKAALELPGPEQKRAFDALKKEGIFHKNIQIQEGLGDLLRERNQGDKQVVMCSGCKGFFGVERICKHKKYSCPHSSNPSADTIHFSKKKCKEVSENFQTNVLDKFRDDDAGNLCRTDKLILLLGETAWCKSVKKERRVVMGEMRLVVNLVLQMRAVPGDENFSGEDVLNRKHYTQIDDLMIKSKKVFSKNCLILFFSVN